MLGFTRVYDYVAGKQDWFANDGPAEGTRPEGYRIGTLALRDVPTCTFDEPLADVLARMDDARWDVCIVVTEDRVVLGRVERDHLEHTEDASTAGATMREGPTTFRPNVGVQEMAAFMVEHERDHVLVTTARGVLIGVIRREDVELRAHELYHVHE
jgi:CBS domain-containing protein